MSHLSHEGQSEVDYCVECVVKHSQTAKVLMREALQRAEANGPHTEGVKEKVRGVVEELSGMEDDTDTTKNDEVTRLNTTARDLRKHIYNTQAEIGGASVKQLQQIKEQVDVLVDKTYTVRESEEDCPTCIVNTASKEKTDVERIDLDKIDAKSKEKRKQFLEDLKQENVKDELF